MENIRNKLIEKNEKQIIKKLTNNFSLKEFYKRKKIENHNAKLKVLNEPIYKLKTSLKNTKTEKTFSNNWHRRSHKYIN